LLRDVVIHIANEQPIIADLLNAPAPSDVALICTNVRTKGAGKPVFIDKSDSTFVFPIVHIRFVEIPSSSMEEHRAEFGVAAEARRARLGLPAPGGTRDRSRDARAGTPPSLGEALAPKPAAAEPAPINPDDLDPDLMRRIREA
jgi:hypothetical protein